MKKRVVLFCILLFFSKFILCDGITGAEAMLFSIHIKYSAIIKGLIEIEKDFYNDVDNWRPEGPIEGREIILDLWQKLCDAREKYEEKYGAEFNLLNLPSESLIRVVARRPIPIRKIQVAFDDICVKEIYAEPVIHSSR